MIAWFAENMLWASGAMLLVLAIRGPVARLFGAGVAYALWLIPAVRLVAPPGDWVAQLFDAPMPSLAPLLFLLDAGGSSSSAPANGGPSWGPALLTLWVAGTILFIAVQGIAYRRFLSRLSLSMRSAGQHDGVPLIESAAVEGPLALGLLDRRIVVPARFEVLYTPAEQRLALDHERHHHRRGDILANHLALLVLAMNWFNPVAWAAFRAFRTDQELSCDAAIAAAATPEARCDYARALIKSASPPGLVAACPLNRADQLKRRLKMLNSHRNDRRRLWAGSAVTTSLLAATLLLGTPGQAHPHPEDGEAKEQRRERVVILERADGAQRRRGDSPVILRRHMSPEVARRIELCREENDIVGVRTRENQRSPVIVLCRKGDGSPGGRVEALQRARERIAREDHLGADARQRVLEELDREIARASGN